MLDVCSAQRCKINMIHITTKFGWHRYQNVEDPLGMSACKSESFSSRVDTHLCFSAYVFVRVLFLVFSELPARIVPAEHLRLSGRPCFSCRLFKGEFYQFLHSTSRVQFIYLIIIDYWIGNLLVVKKISSIF